VSRRYFPTLPYKRYGGLEDLGAKLMKSENFEMAIDEIVWLIVLLMNQSGLIHNLQNAEKRELPTEEAVELLTSPLDLAELQKCHFESQDEGYQGLTFERPVIF
jgi:hypothetical protein